MLFPSEIVALVLYGLQQFGVMLGVGAETIILVLYLASLRDGVVQPKEAQFARAVRRALHFGLGTIALSGAGVVAYHTLLGQVDVVLQPAFLFKWIIIALLLLSILARPRGAAFSHALWEGAVGGTWYALFLVHILAPVTSWPILLGLYSAWLTGFEACWWALAHAMHGGREAMPARHVSVPGPMAAAKPAVIEKKIPTQQSVSKPHPLPAIKLEREQLVPKPVVAVAPAPHKPVPAPVPHKPYVMPAMPVPQKPTPVAAMVPRKPTQAATVPHKPAIALQDQEPPPVLPALHIMPRTPQEVSNQFRGAVVEFKQA